MVLVIQLGRTVRARFSPAAQQYVCLCAPLLKSKCCCARVYLSPFCLIKSLVPDYSPSASPAPGDFLRARFKKTRAVSVSRLQGLAWPAVEKSTQRPQPLSHKERAERERLFFAESIGRESKRGDSLLFLLIRNYTRRLKESRITQADGGRAGLRRSDVAMGICTLSFKCTLALQRVAKKLDLKSALGDIAYS
jgi:hypothetical protein